MALLTGAICILKTAVRRLPALRYAWGVVGLSAAAAIAIKLNGDGKAAVIAGSLAFIGFVLVMVVSTTSKQVAWVRSPAKLLTWSIVIFFVVFLLFTILAYALSWPCNWVGVLEIGSTDCRLNYKEGNASSGLLIGTNDGSVQKLRIDIQARKNATELKRAVEIVHAEYGESSSAIVDFEFVSLANRGPKDDLVVIFDVDGAPEGEHYLSVFATKEQKHELVLSEKIVDFPDIFLVNEGVGTYLLMATYKGSSAYMEANVYRRLRAGNFKRLQNGSTVGGYKWIDVLGDGLYLFSGEGSSRLIFKGDEVISRRNVVASSDFGSATHELSYLNKRLTYDGKLVDPNIPIVIGQAERIMIKHAEKIRVLADGRFFTWASNAAGRMLKPVAKGEGQVTFFEADLTVSFQIR